MEEREEMDGDPHEIIITTRENSSKPRVVRFSDLFSLRDDIRSMMYLWNTNNYYVDVINRIFIINGGRKLGFTDLGPCRVLYRRRNQRTFTLNNGNSGPEKTTLWLIGLEEIGTERKLFLIISEDGHNWSWKNKL